MTSLIRRATFALSVCIFTLNFGFAVRGQALSEQDELVTTQDKARKPCIEFEQVPLTEKRILGLLDSADEIDEIRENSQDGFYKTGPETTAKLDAAARKHGLAGYDEYKTIRANVLLVFSGYDWVTKKYVGREPLIRLRVARTKADRDMSEKGKKEEIASLNAQRVCALPEIKYRGNIDLVHKYHARLDASKFQK
ncbi:hypothetical protein [Bradyrhizobium sp. STM 3843]|uniref:hypothetical protein n=1 Tax=Bradyrhizobium sp. STM 3843 TaxID=551947 RepID=UPI0007C44563|nr:hypothetical protein [Bradyrhizobium sp. STM 3843]